MKIEFGDQADPMFLLDVAAKHGPFDVIVDDGGHKMHYQKVSFNTLWFQFSDGGLYIVEDTHSSYWLGLGGGYRKKTVLLIFPKGWLTGSKAGRQIRMIFFLSIQWR